MSRDNLLNYGEVEVCVSCKETLVQKLGLGIPVGQGVWMDSAYMVVEDGMALPARCVKCNKATENRLKRRVFDWPIWASILVGVFPAISALSLHMYDGESRGEMIGVMSMSFAIPMLGVTLLIKKGIFYYHLCEAHSRQRKFAMWTSFVFFALWILSIALKKMGFVGLEASAVPSVWLFVPAIVAWTIFRGFPVIKIKNGLIRVLGVGKDFAETLPRWKNT